MRFHNRTIEQNVNEAIKIADKLLDPSSKMMIEIYNKTDFKYNSGTGPEVVSKLLIHRAPLEIYAYRPFNPFSRVIGTFDGKAMHLNIRKLPQLSVLDVASNILHEFSHYQNFNHGFGVTANYPSQDKNLFSVPYFISSNISRWI